MVLIRGKQAGLEKPRSISQRSSACPLNLIGQHQQGRLTTATCCLLSDCVPPPFCIALFLFLLHHCNCVPLRSFGVYARVSKMHKGIFKNSHLSGLSYNGARVPTGPDVAGVMLASQHGSDSEFTAIIFPCAVMRRQEIIVQHRMEESKLQWNWIAWYCKPSVFELLKNNFVLDWGALWWG